MELPRGKAVHSSDCSSHHVAVTQREKIYLGIESELDFALNLSFAEPSVRCCIFFFEYTQKPSISTKTLNVDSRLAYVCTPPRSQLPLLLRPTPCLLPRTPPRTSTRVPIPEFRGSGHMSLFFFSEPARGFFFFFASQWLLRFMEPWEGGSGRTITNTARVCSLGDALVAWDWGDARGRQALL
jgi:hypothetical protein